MKILMCNSFHYLRGGAERCFLELSSLLTRQGHTVIPFCMTDERNLPSEYAPYFVSHIDFPTELQKRGIGAKLKVAERVIYSREAQQQIKTLIAAVQPDIAHIHGIAHETSPSILPALQQAGIPVVQTLHDYKLLCPNTTFVSNDQVCESCSGHRYYNVIRKRCKRGSLGASLLAGVEMYAHKLTQIYEKNVDTFISPSDFLRRKVSEAGIRNPVVHIPNFIDVEQFQPCYEPENHFVYCGRLTSVKGITTLIKAMHAVKDSHLYVAGRGEQDAALRAYVQENKLQNVTFLGHLDTPELISLVQRAQFMVTPSEWYENYPMSVLEALACGTPVIGTTMGGIPELVRDGVSGALFEAGNVEALAATINHFLQHRDATIEMGRNGRRQIEEQNNPDLHYAQTMQLYQAVLAKRTAVQ